MKHRLLAKRIGWRLLAGVGVMWGAATFAFITLHATAGDIALATVSGNGSDPTEALLQEVRRDYGLNLPLWEQYTDYIWKLLHGNLGQSYQERIPVATAIGPSPGHPLSSRTVRWMSCAICRRLPFPGGTFNRARCVRLGWSSA